MAYVFIYLAIGIVWHGVEYAAWQGSYPHIAKKDRKTDRVWAAIAGAIWPAAIIGAALLVILSKEFRFHGIRFK